MLATEQARLESWQLGLSLKGRRRRPNSRIVRGSCPAQVGSKKRGWPGFPIETRFQRQRNRPQVSGRARLERCPGSEAFGAPKFIGAGELRSVKFDIGFGT